MLDLHWMAEQAPSQLSYFSSGFEVRWQDTQVLWAGIADSSSNSQDLVLGSTWGTVDPLVPCEGHRRPTGPV